MTRMPSRRASSRTAQTISALRVPRPRSTRKERSTLRTSMGRRSRQEKGEEPGPAASGEGARARLEASADVGGGRGVAADEALGHLELQPLRVDAGFAHRGGDALDEVAV